MCAYCTYTHIFFTMHKVIGRIDGRFIANFHHAKAMTATSITQPSRRHQYRQFLDRSGGILPQGEFATQSLELKGLAAGCAGKNQDIFLGVEMVHDHDYHVLLIILPILQQSEVCFLFKHVLVKNKGCRSRLFKNKQE